MFPLRRPLILSIAVYLAFFILLLPLFPANKAPADKPVTANAVLNPLTPYTSEAYLIYDEGCGDVIEVPREEFVTAAVALEMSPDSPREALKAQAIAARSYYDSLKQTNIHREFHFICDSEKGIIYAPKEYFQKLWGEEYGVNMENIRGAVKETEGLVLTYGGHTALAAYFPVSSGVTVADPEHPYLISVASPYDSLSPYFEESQSFSPEEVMEICKATWPEGRFDFDMDYENWFSEIVFSTGSVVYSTNICGFGVTGNEVREAFSLASSAFTVEFKEGEFIIRTRGMGHGVGMSQQGALQMAGMGASCEEILSWYYPGTVLVEG